MRISLCNEVIAGLDFAPQCELAAALGYDGLEIAPMTLSDDPTRLSAARIAELRRAVIYGSVMGSFCCEKFGVDRFRTLTREEIEARYQEFRTCTSF